MQQYDEDLVLARYIWNHYLHLFTDFELRVRKVIFVRSKAPIYSNKADSADGFKNLPSHPEDISLSLQKALKELGDDNDPEINAALANGVDAYRREVYERILREHADIVFINRCPKCEKIVRTPQAKLCLWCGHHWFNA